MYYDEEIHHGRPHFHARYGDFDASYDIDDVRVIAGRLPNRAERLVIEWAENHREELHVNWKRARLHLPLHPIEPLG